MEHGDGEVAQHHSCVSTLLEILVGLMSGGGGNGLHKRFQPFLRFWMWNTETAKWLNATAVFQPFLRFWHSYGA